MPRSRAARAIEIRDTNEIVAGLLRDLAAVQESTHSNRGYRRASAAIRDLDVPLETLVRPDGSLEKIQFIGPSSTRVILEVLTTGGSPTVERAIAASPKRSEAEKARRLRGRFLSRAQVLAALENPALGGPERNAYRGDLQMHSVWSDGSQTLEEICQTGIARGYAYAAVTDHSYGLPIAGGISMTALAEQHHEIDRLNDVVGARFRLLKGIEANIRADGSIDMTESERARLEIVVAAPHAALRSMADQTPRMLAAVTAPAVHILGHPRGRMYASRPGVAAEWPRIFAAAAESGVAIELDGDPARQDLDYALAAEALPSGCLFALDSDAHSAGEWRYAETAIAHARLAGIPAERIINCWQLDRLLGWADSRR